jgi:hypothetical protein
MRITVFAALLAASMVAGLTQPPLAGPKSPCCTRPQGWAEGSSPRSADVQKSENPRLGEARRRGDARQRCEGVEVEVEAHSEAERTLACSAAGEALELLGRCNIHPRSQLSIHISGQALHPQKGPTFGLFNGQAAIVSNLSSATSLAAGTAYALLSANAFYESLVVHEIVHVVMHQNYERLPTSHAAYEYPAYALQIMSLHSADRIKLLHGIDNHDNPPGLLFNDILLAMDPLIFAASAYEHFSAAPDACRLLKALLKGEVDFIPTLPPWL